MSGSVDSASPAAAEAVEIENEAKLLSFVEDCDGGVIVVVKEAMDSATFASVLRASISHWREQGKRDVSIILPIEHANLVNPAVAEGFLYYDVEPKCLMLGYGIPQSADTIPAKATHRIGVGVLVMNEKDEVLVVQEKTGISGGTVVWKFPTGVVNEGEDICAAAVREVKEETGIDAEFVEVLGFWESHQKSDLFFICFMRPKSLDIEMQDVEIELPQWMPFEENAVQPFCRKNELVKHAKETLGRIKKGKSDQKSSEWMLFEEYAAQPFCQENELVKYMVDMCRAKKKGKYTGFTPVPTPTTMSESNLYLDSHFRSGQ